MQHRWSKSTQLKCLLVIATITLLCGLFLPLITVSKFVLLNNTFSIVSGVLQLLKDGHVFLFFIIGTFSILLPTLKLILITRWVFVSADLGSVKHRWLLSAVHRIGRWSMLDVFVVSVLVVAVKLAGVASVKMEYGLYFFTAAVISTMLLTHTLYDISHEVAGE